MGWIVILAIILIFDIIAAVATAEGLNWTAYLVAIALVFAVADVMDNDQEVEKFTQKYNATVELVETLDSPSDVVITNILDINKKITKSKAEYEKEKTSWWNRGCTPKEIGDMPLIEIPDRWKVSNSPTTTEKLNE